MDPFFLTFRDPALERRYVRHIAAVKNLNIDRCYWWWAFIVRGIAYWRYAVRFGPGHFAVARVYLAWLVAEAVLRRTSAMSSLPHLREPLVVISRLIHTVEVGTMAEHSLSDLLDFQGDHLSMKSIMTSLMIDGLIPMMFLGLFQPLRFWLHLPVHLISSIFILGTMNLQVCSLTGGAGVPGMTQILMGLDATAKHIVGTVFTTHLNDEPSWKVECPCLQMAMFNQGYLGFAIISYFLWVSEHNSRVAFLEMQPERHELGDVVEPLPRTLVFLHVMLLVVGYGILWRIFMGVAPDVMRVGICSAVYVMPRNGTCTSAL